jgi:hypothetical protein
MSTHHGDNLAALDDREPISVSDKLVTCPRENRPLLRQVV